MAVFHGSHQDRKGLSNLLIMLFFGYLGLFFPDIDQLLLRILHHRSIVTHCIAAPLVFMSSRDLSTRFGAAGLMLGISVHLAADVLSRPFGFAKIWLPWPIKMSLGPLSVLWMGANALLGLVIVKLILVQIQPTRPLLVYYLFVLVFGVSYALWYEKSAKSLVSFGLIFGLSLWSTSWIFRQHWFEHLATLVHLRPMVTLGKA